MIKRSFLAFILVVGTLIGGLIWFIQSPQFAIALKQIAYRYLPENIGIQGDFSDLSIRIFPPGFSVMNPKLILGGHNIVGMPAGSAVSAERIDFSFRFFQIFSGDIRIHEVSIVNGDIRLVLEPPLAKKQSMFKGGKLDFHWDELLQVKADGIGLNNVSLSVQIKGLTHVFQTNAKKLLLSQWAGRGGLGYYLQLDLNQTQGSYLVDLGLSESIEHIQGEVYINALGLQLDSFFISNPSTVGGLEVSISGRAKGNILEFKKLTADITVKAKGEIAKILKMRPSLIHPRNIPGGLISLDCHVQGDLLSPMNSLRIDGQLTGKRMSFRKWKADLIHVDASWNASPSGGEFLVNKATIAAREQSRVGGFQPGSGGKVEIGPVRWVVGSTLPLKVPMRFERTHLHWLGASALAEVYPLDFRISGNVGLIFVSGTRDHDWGVDLQLDLGLEPFQLDNQRYLQVHPLTSLFKIPKINIKGPVSLSAGEIHPNNISITFGSSKIIANGKVHFKNGYDLYGTAQVNLADFGSLAETEIRGQGTLGIRVHGRSSGVLIDIDADLQNAYYLNLALGSLKGRFTWDDSVDHLNFRKVEVTKNLTHCVVDGVLDLGLADKVNLIANISEGNIRDLFQIFSHFTRSFDWFPSDLAGPVIGDILVSGGMSMPKLKILTHLKGTNWERWGENFKSVNLSGGYEGGKYFIDDFKAFKKSAYLEGRISYQSDRTLSWDFRTDDFSVSDLDHIAQLDVPIRGKLNVMSTGKGVEGLIESNTVVNLTDFSVRGSGAPPSRLSWKSEKGISHLQAMLMGGQGTLDMLYNMNPKELSMIRGDLKQLDFTPILLVLNPKSIQDKALAGFISATADLSFHAGEFERANGAFAIGDYLLSRSDVRFSLENPQSIQVSNGNFEIKGLTLKGKTGEVSLDLLAKNTLLEGRVRGNFDTAIAEFFTPWVVQASGTLGVDLSIGGSLKKPAVFGTGEFQGGAVRISSIDSPFENLTGSLQLRENVLHVQNFHADLGGGAIFVDGKLIIYPDRYPEVLLKGTISGSKVKIYPFQYVQVKGAVSVHGDKVPYVVDGNLVIDSGLCKEKVFNQKQGSAGLKALPYAPPSNKTQETNSSKFKLNIEVDADRGILIQNDLFRDVEAKGNMTLVNTLDSPKIVGHVEVVRGKLLFKNHVFQIQNASAKFDSPTTINPSFELNANTEVNGIKIQMYTSGRMNKVNRIEFISNPSMPESEILSLLTVGLTSSDAKKLSSSDQNVVQQGEVTSLLLHSLDFNRDFEDKTGFQVQLDESVNPQQGVSVLRPQSQADTAVAPQITIRRKLGERLSLSAGSTVGVGSNKSNQVNLDYSVSRDISVSGVFTNYGASGTADTQQNTQNSLGLDLKFQKRFK